MFQISQHMATVSLTRTLRRRFSTTSWLNMKVVPVPVREDNYSYLIIDEPSNNAAAVDPYDVPKIKAAAEHLGVKIIAGITTHHHFDHSGGNQVSTSIQFQEVERCLP